MKLYFKNANEVTEGITLLAPELNVILDEKGIPVTVSKAESETVTVKYENGEAFITYGIGKARFFRGLSTLVDMIKKGKEGTVTENPMFTTNGAMVDMSRNAVMNVKTVKTMLRKMALMGLNTFMLYTEDTYEIEEYPYFGHMRGRYTKEEIKELDRYALTLGIELIPCIQMLGHLATHLIWRAAGEYKDTANTLLVGSEKTYALIDAMLKTISECFTSKRIHIGMDETHDLGLGNYIERNGFRERQDIYFEHLEKIRDMILSYGLEPMMWSDMFFRLAGKDIKNFLDYDRRVVFTEEDEKKVPKGIHQVFWDYYNANKDFYTENIDKHRQLFKEDPLFAGGIWCWSAYCPIYSLSYGNTIPAFEACKEKGIKEMIATIWHNGSECSLIMSLLALTWYADFDYKNEHNMDTVKECFERTCGVKYDSLLKFQIPEKSITPGGCVTRALVYNDPLVGLIDKDIAPFDMKTFYENAYKELSEADIENELFVPATDTIVKLCDLLINKSDFGIRLKKAYDTGDRNALKPFIEECDVITKKLNALKDCHRSSWLIYNKAFGWEVHDIRYGGLLARFDTAKALISAYVEGKLERIDELEEERLSISNSPESFVGLLYWGGYKSYATVNIL